MSEKFGRIDVHCHLLPGIDDGCESLEESIECARVFIQNGYTHIFCTPHIWSSLPRNTVGNIRRWTTQLQEELDRRLVAMRVFPGGEVNLTPEYSRTSPKDVATYNGLGKHVIFDLWADRLPPHFTPTVKWLQSLGMTTILAHPERMRAVQDEPILANYFEEIGVLLQGNLQCFADPVGSATRLTAERFLEEDRYFLLGSDCHGSDTLPMRMQGLKNAIRLAGDAVVDRLTIENPRKLLGG